MLICDLKSFCFSDFGNIIVLGHILVKFHLKQHMQALTKNKTNLIQKQQNNHTFAEHCGGIQVLSTPRASEIQLCSGCEWSLIMPITALRQQDIFMVYLWFIPLSLALSKSF